MPQRRVALYWLSFAAIALFSVSPLILVYIAAVIAELYGCRLDEGGVYPCHAFGTEMGETLNVMFVSGWFGLMTMPAGAALFCVWALVLAVDLIRLRILRRRARQAGAP